MREQLIATSEIPKLDALRGKDGKYRRVTRIVTNTAKEAERAQEALQTLGDKAPRKDLELRLAEQESEANQKLEMVKGREVQPPGDGRIRLYHCPFQRLEEVAGIEPDSVDLDPDRYPLWRGFFAPGRRPRSVRYSGVGAGGLLVTYSGHTTSIM